MTDAWLWLALSMLTTSELNVTHACDRWNGNPRPVLSRTVRGSTGRSSPRPTHAWASTERSSPQDSPTPQQADKHDNLSLATRTQQAEKHHMPCCPTARWPGPTGTCLFILSPIHSSRCLMIHSIIRSVIQSVIVTVIHWTKASRRMSTQSSSELVGECQRREELNRALVIHWIVHSIIHHTCDGTPTGHQRDARLTFLPRLNIDAKKRTDKGVTKNVDAEKIRIGW